MGTLAANALTTLARVLSHMGMTSGTEDDLLEYYINVASDRLQRDCGRIFGKQTLTAEKHTGAGQTILQLKHFPVIGTATVTVDAVAETGFVLTAASGLLELEDGWPEDAEILVTYVAGYVLPKDAAAAITGPPAVDAVIRTLPYDLENACVVIASGLYNMRGSEHLKREKVGPLESEFWDDPPAVKDTILRYGVPRI